MVTMEGATSNGENLNFSFCKEKKENVYEVIETPTTCRTYLSDVLYRLTMNPKYEESGILLSIRKDQNGKLLSLDKDHTKIFVMMKNDSVIKELNLSFLHEKEKQAGTKLTECLLIDTDTVKGYIFIGDPAWQSCLWKCTLYTHYIKKQLEPECNSTYQEALDPFENKLLSKILTEFQEKFWDCFNKKEILNPLSFSLVHEWSGFYSICIGINKVMYDLLLKE